MLAREILVILLSYLIGSIPFAYLLGHAFKGIDIRQSGNVGTLSVMRDVGPIAGFVNLILDSGKGALAVGLALWLNVPSLVVYICGFTAVLGHSWPIFLQFKGGGGLATTLGVLLGLAPGAFGISFALMAAAVLFTSNVRFGAGIGLVFLPLFIWLLGGHLDLILFSVILPLLMVIRNILKFKHELAVSPEKKSLIMDKNYTPWQTRKKKD